MHSLEVGEKRWVLRRDGRVGGWLRGGGCHGAVVPHRDDHPPHTTLRHPSLAPRRTSIVHSGFVAFLAALLQALPLPDLAWSSNSVFSESRRRAGWVNKGNLLLVFRDVFATNVFHRNIFGERRFPRRRQERPPRMAPHNRNPLLFFVSRSPPTVFPIAAIDRRHSVLEESTALRGWSDDRTEQPGQRATAARERARGASEKTTR